MPPESKHSRRSADWRLPPHPGIATSHTGHTPPAAPGAGKIWRGAHGAHLVFTSIPLAFADAAAPPRFPGAIPPAVSGMLFGSELVCVAGCGSTAATWRWSGRAEIAGRAARWRDKIWQRVEADAAHVRCAIRAAAGGGKAALLVFPVAGFQRQGDAAGCRAQGFRCQAVGASIRSGPLRIAAVN